MTAIFSLRVSMSRRQILGAAGAMMSGCASGAVAAEERAFASFFGPGVDARTVDCSAALQAAWRWSAANGGVVRIGGRYRLDRTALLTDDGAHFLFDGAAIDVFERQLSGRLSNGAAGPIGILCTARNARMTGDLTLTGRGVVGRTAMAGIVFDGADGMETGRLTVSNMAAGRMALWCRGASFGDIAATDMRGTQTLGAGTAGSADVVVGCTDCRFGNVVSTRNYKPVRYLSVAIDGAGRRRDTARCTFGTTAGTAFPGSAESSLLAVRSAVDCRFATVSGQGFGLGVAFVSYAGDDGFSVRDNRVDAVRVENGDTPASTDAALSIDRAEGAPAIGHQTIGTLVARDSGYYGIFANDGALTISAATIDTAIRPVQLRNCRVAFGSVTIRGRYVSAFGYGRGVSGTIDRLVVEGGATVSGANAVQNLPGERTAGLRFKTIVYQPATSGPRLARIFADTESGPDEVIVDRVNGTGSAGTTWWRRGRTPRR